MTKIGATEITEIAALRQKIDRLDGEIAKLLLQRARLSFAVRTRKKKIGRAVRDSAREQEIVTRYVHLAVKKGGAPAAMEACASSILSFSRKFDPTR
ncbi:MAG: chorismate mutase [Polyangiaceae bacterium]|nr:chorismate mutase [Polyangiaceae bacterium]